MSVDTTSTRTDRPRGSPAVAPFLARKHDVDLVVCAARTALTERTWPCAAGGRKKGAEGVETYTRTQTVAVTL